MPGTSRAIFTQLGSSDSTISIPDALNGDAFPAGHSIATPEHLFSNIHFERTEEWRKAFSGKQVVRKQAVVYGRENGEGKVVGWHKWPKA